MSTLKTPPQQKKWKEIITPDVPHLYFPYKEIWKRKYLLYLFVRQYFVSKYKQTILGPAWAIIQPLLSTAIFTIVFNKVLNLSTGNTPPILFYLLGNTIWLFFSTSFMRVAGFLAGNASILTRVSIPKQIIPISYIASDLITSSIQFFVFLILFMYYAYNGLVEPNLYILLFPVLYLVLIVFSLGLGYVFACISLKYRDLMQLYAYFIHFFMYLTPVIYPLHMVDGANKRLLLQMNPLAGIFEFMRYGFLGEGYISGWMLLYSVLFSVTVFMLGLFLLSRAEKFYADIVAG